MQQDDARLCRVPGLVVEDPEARNLGGFEVHRALSNLDHLARKLIRPALHEIDLRGTGGMPSSEDSPQIYMQWEHRTRWCNGFCMRADGHNEAANRGFNRRILCGDYA